MRLLRLGLAGVLAASGCSDSPPDSVAGPSENAAKEIDSRPSIVLIVVESLRTDAVASYGPDRSSPLPIGNETATPNLDLLAESGIRYAWAIAASPETVTSHASILTGLRGDQHGAGVWTNPIATDEIETIAETLRATGYETVGFSENPMVGPEFGLDQGFDRFLTPKASQAAAMLSEGRSSGADFRVVARVRRWLRDRDSSRPYLLFVNLADPHHPLEQREGNRFLPQGLSKARIDNVLANRPHEKQICRKLPDPEALEILAAFYLGEVESADRKLGQIVDLTRVDASTTSRIRPATIVTADHGTHFGEHRLLGHLFSVDNRVLRVPLIVVPSKPSVGVIEGPVAQRRLAASIRCWAGDKAACKEGLPVDEPTATEPIISILGNEIVRRPPAGVVDSGSLDGATNYANALCRSGDGFRGRALSYLEGPHKFIWRQHAPPSLFDLSWDPNESSDQIERQAETAGQLRKKVESFVARHRIDEVHREPVEDRLPETARRAYSAARHVVLQSKDVAIDAVWFAQLAVQARPDPEISTWIDRRITEYEQDPFFPIIVPHAKSPQQLPANLGRGLARWRNYLLASVAGADSIAMPHLEDYLGMDTNGYILTHQLTALEWARAMGRPLPKAADERRAKLLERIADEHARDPYFSDLWVERSAFLTVYGEPDEKTLEEWAAFIVEHHLGGGDWGHGGTDITFDGQSLLGEQVREHVTGMAMIVLAHYLEQISPPG